MPAALSAVKIARAGQVFMVTFDVDFSGNYTTGGDVPSTSLLTLLPWFGSKTPSFVFLKGILGQMYHWQPTTQKILGFTSVGVQFTNAAAYPEAKIQGLAVYMPEM